MAFRQGKYGVVISPRETETHHLRRFVIVDAVVVSVAFAAYRLSRWWASRKETARETPPHLVGTLPELDESALKTNETSAATTRPMGATTNLTRNEILARAHPATKITLPPPQPSPTVPPEVRPLVRQLQATEAVRPLKEQVLIRKYTEAERQGNIRNAVDALAKLYDQPTMADLSDPLMRRLGDLHMDMLTNVAMRAKGEPTPWTKRVTVHRGDGRERLAKEHRNTTAALMKLNPTLKWEKIRPGDSITVLDYPNAVLVIHKQTGAADLSLREKFFRRYYLSTAKSARCDVYPVGSEAKTTLHARFREPGVRLAAADRAELEMFLAPGSRITVSEQ